MIIMKWPPKVKFFKTTAFATLCFLISTAASADDNLARHKAMFPDAAVAPPRPVAGSDGVMYIPGWENAGWDDAYYEPIDGQHAGYLQIVRENDGFDIDSFLDLLISEAKLLEVDRPKAVEAEGFKSMYGPMVAAVFGKATHKGKPVEFFADLYGPNDENNVIGTVIFGSAEMFEKWDGVLMPLFVNGYVKDTSVFDNKKVLRAGTDAEKTDFYVGMINAKIMAEFGALLTISEGALQAARNATTIAGCAGASNCSVSYDGMGNAVADFDVQ